MSTLNLRAGVLSLTLSDQGRILGLSAVDGQEDVVHTGQPSHILSIIERGRSRPEPPGRLEVLAIGAGGGRLRLHYDGGATVDLDIGVRPRYLRLEVAGVASGPGIAEIHWGPYATTMEGPLGDALGLLRQRDLTIGLLGLQPNVDGESEDGYGRAASYLPAGLGGSQVAVLSVDRTGERTAERRGLPIPADPVAGRTLVGSAAALFACRPSHELDVIEEIVLAEALPHPLLDGRWAKRSPQATRSSFWADYDATTIDAWIGLALVAGIRVLCRYNQFGNWGHFWPDRRVYPEGHASIAACSAKAAAAGICTSAYTLTNFLAGGSLAEPYLSPVPDQRLCHHLPAMALAAEVGPADATLWLCGASEALTAALTGSGMGGRVILRLGDELVSYTDGRVGDGRLQLLACMRGLLGTAAAAHGQGARVLMMLYEPSCWYHALFPGSEAMNAEIAANIAEAARAGGHRHVVLDGLEGTFSTGNGTYAMNTFHLAVHARLHADDITCTTSRLSQFGWHLTTYISWGEWDREKGFRGTMLDYRLSKQVQMRRNLMPSKLGQYYPDRQTTAEDIEWLMGLAAGHDAGVDFAMNFYPVDEPGRERLFALVRRWEEARLAGSFTEGQKMLLRQTDCLFTLDHRADGGESLRFVRRWRSERFQAVPSTAAPARAITGRVEPCGIDHDWTHDPGICQRSCLSDDLVHPGGAEGSEFDVNLPWAMPGRQVLFVLRVPADAAGPVRHPWVEIRSGPGPSGHHRLRFPVVLQPGQYLSVPHQCPVACLYDAGHRLLRDVDLTWLPVLDAGVRSLRVRIAGGQAGAGLIANLRFHEPWSPGLRPA